MADTPTPTPKIDPTRQALMRIGGVFTIKMAQAGFTPEDVSKAGMNYIPVEDLYKIMTGSNVDVPVSRLFFLAGQLNVPLTIGVVQPSEQSSSTAVVISPGNADHR